VSPIRGRVRRVRLGSLGREPRSSSGFSIGLGIGGLIVVFLVASSPFPRTSSVLGMPVGLFAGGRSMFIKECAEIREAVYGVRAVTPRGPQHGDASHGSGFMIAPGIVATAAHLIHMEGDITKPVHATFQVVRAPEVGVASSTASLIGEDIARDVVLLRIRGTQSLLVSVWLQMRFQKVHRADLSASPSLPPNRAARGRSLSGSSTPTFPRL
jgi:hypothetical protein